MPDAPVTRGEFDMLRQIVTGNQARLEGVNAIAVVQTQITEVIKDLTELKADVTKRFDAHMEVHEQDQAARLNGRRWQVGTLIAVLVLLVSILGLVINMRPAG